MRLSLSCWWDGVLRDVKCARGQMEGVGNRDFWVMYASIEQDFEILHDRATTVFT